MKEDNDMKFINCDGRNTDAYEDVIRYIDEAHKPIMNEYGWIKFESRNDFESCVRSACRAMHVPVRDYLTILALLEDRGRLGVHRDPEKKTAVARFLENDTIVLFPPAKASEPKLKIGDLVYVPGEGVGTVELTEINYFIRFADDRLGCHDLSEMHPISADDIKLIKG